ncbi:MAG: hypothetical protein HY791_12840 [Deltaproteobacteria bacterium]|nr:hypothetical protein [Deltaproteobacteria bacterium]
MSTSDPPITNAERRAVEAWPASKPPADFTERVMSELMRRRSRRRMMLALAAAGLLALATTLELPDSGTLVASVRETRAIGRATLVAEPGSSVSWQVDAFGNASIRQDAGNVFYRVEPGKSFELDTIAGTVRVVGTCFRVEVMKMSQTGSSWKAGAAGAVIGAVASAWVTVSVYEGTVSAVSGDSGQAPTRVAAGEVATLERGKPIKPTPMGVSSIGLSTDPQPAEPGTPKLPEAPETKIARLERQTAALQADNESLKKALAEKSGEARKQKVFDLPPEELAGMASRCELRWDLPSLSGRGSVVSDEDAKNLGLSEDELKVITDVTRKSQAKLIAEITRTYREVTGDDGNVGSLSAESMLTEINDKLDPIEIKKAFQRLSAERAGLPVPPTEMATSYERMMRTVIMEGDELERAIGDQLGPDLAKRIRKNNGGWNDKSRSSHGCP